MEPHTLVVEYDHSGPFLKMRLAFLKFYRQKGRLSPHV